MSAQINDIGIEPCADGQLLGGRLFAIGLYGSFGNDARASATAMRGSDGWGIITGTGNNGCTFSHEHLRTRSIVATANGYVAPAAPCFHIASVEELDAAARASFAAADIQTTANTLGFEFASSYDNTTTIKIFRYIRTAATDGRTVFAIVIDFQYRKLTQPSCRRS